MMPRLVQLSIGCVYEDYHSQHAHGHTSSYKHTQHLVWMCVCQAHTNLITHIRHRLPYY